MDPLPFDLPGLGPVPSAIPTTQQSLMEPHAQAINSAVPGQSQNANAVNDPGSSQSPVDIEDGGTSDVSMGDLSSIHELRVDKKRKREKYPAQMASRKMRQLQHNRGHAAHMVPELSNTNRRQAICQFVRIWLDAGLSYTLLKAEVEQKDLLDTIVREMLSTPQIGGSNVAAEHQATAGLSQKEPTDVNSNPISQVDRNEARKAAPPMKSLPSRSPVAPNRAEYLARLQALRARPASDTAVPEATKMSALGQQPPMEPFAGERTSIDQSNRTIAGTTNPVGKPSINTELIRKKMEALKVLAAKRAKDPTGVKVGEDTTETSSGHTSVVTSSANTPRLSIPTVVTSPLQPGTASAIHSKVKQLGIASTGSASPVTGPREPFGLGGISNSDDTVVIDISDDDDSESEVEPPPRGRPNPVRTLSQTPVVSTSRSRSANNTQQTELARKQKDIAALKEKIAQHSIRKKALAAVAAQHDSKNPIPNVHSPGKAAESDSTVHTSRIALDAPTTSLLRPASAPVELAELPVNKETENSPCHDTVKVKMQQLELLQEQAEQIQAELDADTPYDGPAISKELVKASPMMDRIIDLDGSPEQTGKDAISNDRKSSSSQTKAEIRLHKSANAADADTTASSGSPGYDSHSDTDSDSAANATDADMDISSSDRDESSSDQDSRVQQIVSSSKAVTPQRPRTADASDTDSSYSPFDAMDKDDHREPGLSISSATAQLALEMSGDQAPGITSAGSSMAQPSQTTTSGHYFQPYKSPLQAFRQYRFHPNYLQTVPGGFRSRTFSHQIDSNNELCRFELDGGICNDPKCSYQHFRDMEPSDNAILVQLGSHSANPGQTDEEREQYSNGLMGLIRQLKTDDITDIEEIASRITQYRRDFIGDVSKIFSI